MNFEVDGQEYEPGTLVAAKRGALGPEWVEWADNVIVSLIEGEDYDWSAVQELETAANEREAAESADAENEALLNEWDDTDANAWEEKEPSEEPERPAVWGPEWVAEMRYRVEQLEGEIGRKLTEAEGTALVQEVEPLPKIPDLRDAFAEQLAARENTPEGRREVMTEEFEDRLDWNDISIGEEPEPTTDAEKQRAEMVEALKRNEAGEDPSPEPALVGAEEEAEVEE